VSDAAIRHEETNPNGSGRLLGTRGEGYCWDGKCSPFLFFLKQTGFFLDFALSQFKYWI
jgi:hypothetical protein